MPEYRSPDYGSTEDVDRLWDLITRRGVPPTTLHRVRFSLACPDRASAQFLAQYLEHAADSTWTAARPRVANDAHEYWYLEVTSDQGPFSLLFLRRTCGTVRTAAKRFGCRITGYWGTS